MNEARALIDDQTRLDLLREALPYIQRFKGHTFVVKLSGKVTEDPANLASLAEELALLHQVGIRICVVHGGGKQLSELASKLGIEQTIIEGRRVTDDATLEMAKMIFAGKINTDILAALRQRGIEAVGLSGVDGNIGHAERRPPREILTSRPASATRLISVTSATWCRSTRACSPCFWTTVTCP
ncbi:MAG TPA: acetylglutamate kinase [Pyrinomonadaceae bacterium]|nr:acetylglutamate kinase [Pyrinomonadaceae bacterium]